MQPTTEDLSMTPDFQITKNLSGDLILITVEAQNNPLQNAKVGLLIKLNIHEIIWKPGGVCPH